MKEDRKTRFIGMLDALEEQLDKGFFLSFINKIVVDEKKIFTIINELRSLASDHFEAVHELERQAEAKARAAARAEKALKEKQKAVKAPEPAVVEAQGSLPPALAPVGEEVKEHDIVKKALAQAESLKRDAEKYAQDVLEGLEDKLNNAMDVIKEGRKVLEDRTHNTGGD